MAPGSKDMPSLAQWIYKTLLFIFHVTVILEFLCLRSEMFYLYFKQLSPFLSLKSSSPFGLWVFFVWKVLEIPASKLWLTKDPVKVTKAEKELWPQCKTTGNEPGCFLPFFFETVVAQKGTASAAGSEPKDRHCTFPDTFFPEKLPEHKEPFKKNPIFTISFSCLFYFFLIYPLFSPNIAYQPHASEVSLERSPLS